MHFEDGPETTPIRQLGFIVGVFALVGIGGGLTGAIGISQLGSGSGIGGQIISGVLTIVILVVMALLGPVIAVITSLRSADKLGGNWPSYLTGLLGSVIGYFVMIFLVIGIIVAGLGIASGIGGSQDSGATGQTGAPSPTQTPSSGIPTSSGTSSSTTPKFGDYILPIIALAIPSGLAGLGASYIGGRMGSGPSSETTPELPRRSIAGMSLIVVAIVVLLVGAAVFTPGSGINFGNGDPANIRIDTQQTGFYNQNGQLYSEARLTHTGDVPVETTVTARMVIAGQVDEQLSTTKTITLEPGESRTVRINIAELRNGVVGASEEQQRQINSNNFGFELLINGERRYTV